jgi:hypothetical protein
MLNNKVSKAVRLAIAFGAASTAAFSASSFAAEEENVEKYGINLSFKHIKLIPAVDIVFAYL